MPNRKSRTRRTAGRGAAAESRVVQVRYTDPDQVPLEYANNFYINHTEHEFVITLAALVPPPVLHMTSEELSALDHVDARVVARVAMSPGRFREFVSGARENYRGWAETHGTTEAEMVPE